MEAAGQDKVVGGSEKKSPKYCLVGAAYYHIHFFKE